MTENLLIIYGAFFIAALVFSLIINRFLLKFAKTLGIRNSGETIIRWSATSKPSLGGISFYIVFLFSVILISFIFPDGTVFFNLQSLGILGVVTLGFLLGLFDDAWNTKPWIKFFTQMICGVFLIVTGTYIQIFESNLFNYLLTLFWVVGMMNSINMLDNMDGITAIVSFAIAVTIFTGILLRNELQNPILVIILGLMAVLIAFLYYNWNPSKMYMGDTGSQFLGVLLALLGIIFFWNGEGFSIDSTPLMRFITVAIIFALPIIDTTTVFYKRIAKGGSPFVGGKDHTTHHLSYLGLSDRSVALVFTGISILSLAFAIIFTQFISKWTLIHHIILVAYFIILFGFLFIVGNMNKRLSQ